MAIERSIIKRSQPYIISAMLNEVLQKESSKGCLPVIHKNPVNLEPPYVSALDWDLPSRNIQVPIYNNIEHYTQSLKRLRCWIPKEYNSQWFRAERFIKILSAARKRICFEIFGNKKEIEIEFIVEANDLDLLKVGFNGEYQDCELTILGYNKLLLDDNLLFRDYYPNPPYHHILTRSTELTTSPYDTFIMALSNLEEDCTGFVQIVFEPVRNNWHQNVEKLNDIEFLGNIINDPRSSARIKQQLPSTDIRNMARDVETKAHNDKPFYSVAIKSGIITKENIFDIGGLTSFLNLFQHGGQPLNYITQDKYKEIFSQNEILSMFNQGLTFRSGFLLNSSELAGLVHIPSLKELGVKNVPINFLEKKELVSDLKIKHDGITLGWSSYADEIMPVSIEDTIRKTGTHIIGRSGSGKSTLIENMILQNIEQNKGLALLDPHGDTINRLLKLIPKEKVESTIYLDFGNPDFIVIWNPIKKIPLQSIGRTADDLVSSFKSIIKSNAWGDRLEHLLRNGFVGLLHLEDSTLYDLLILFEQSSTQSCEKKLLIQSIRNVVKNPVSNRFWNKDFANYKRDDLTPPHHKLSKLLNSDESVSLMLSQPSSFINFQTILESNKILLLDLSNIGPDTRKVLGSYLLSILHNHSISKNKIDIEKRSQFNIYCDEAYKFTPDTLEDMITDARKFGINLTFAHQYLNQFNIPQRDALLSTGSTIIFNVDLADARLLVNNLQGKVEIKDIATLKTGEAITRIGTEIIKIETELSKTLPTENYKNEIIQYSHKNYYKPLNEVKRIVKERLKRYGINMSNNEIVTNLVHPETIDQKYEYDEFE